MIGQGQGALSRMIGDVEVVAVSDGVLNSSLIHFIEIERSECERLAGVPADGPLPLAVNAFVVRSPGSVILIDAGSGSSMGPTLGHLVTNLRAAGISPDSVDHVLLTHIHADHSNGLIAEDGRANFSNADVFVHEQEAHYWLDLPGDPNEPDMRRRNRANAARAFAAYQGRVRRIREGEALPGISAHLQAGHTPGHTGWLLRARREALLFWGDIVHVAAVQLPRPDAALTFDIDPVAARAARRRVYDWVANDRIQVAGAHLDRGFGYLARKGTGYQFEPDA